MSAVGPRKEMAPVWYVLLQPLIWRQWTRPWEVEISKDHQCNQPAAELTSAHQLPIKWLYGKNKSVYNKASVNKELQGCWSEHFVVYIKPPLPPPFNGNLIFPSFHVPFSVLFCFPLDVRDHTPVLRAELWQLGQQPPSSVQEQEWKRFGLLGTWGRPSPYYEGGMRLWREWTWLQ